MNLKEWLKEVELNNGWGAKRQSELQWLDWDCAENTLDSRTRAISNLLKDVINDRILNFDIKLYNQLAKENFGGTFDTVYLMGEGYTLGITRHDFTEMYKYNVYSNDLKIFSCEEKEELVAYLNRL